MLQQGAVEFQFAIEERGFWMSQNYGILIGRGVNMIWKVITPMYTWTVQLDCSYVVLFLAMCQLPGTGRSNAGATALDPHTEYPGTPWKIDTMRFSPNLQRNIMDSKPGILGSKPWFLGFQNLDFWVPNLDFPGCIHKKKQNCKSHFCHQGRLCQKDGWSKLGRR